MKLNRFGLMILLLVSLVTSALQAQANQCEARFGLLPVPTNEALQTTTGRNDHFPMGKRGLKDVAAVQNNIFQSIQNLTQHLDPETQEAFKNLFGQGGPFLNADFPTIMADALSNSQALSQQLQNFMGVESFADGEILAEIAEVTTNSLQTEYGENRVYSQHSLSNREYFEVRKRALRYFTLAIQEDSYLSQHPEIRGEYRKALLMWGTIYSMVSFNLFDPSHYTVKEQSLMNNNGAQIGFFPPVLHTALSGGATGFTFIQLAETLSWASLMSPEGIVAALASGTVLAVTQFYRGRGQWPHSIEEGFLPDRNGTFISPLRIFFKEVMNRARRRKLKKQAKLLQEALQSGQMQLVDGRSRRAIESANTVKEDGEVNVPMIEKEINLDAHIAQIRAQDDDQNEMEYALSQFVIDGQKLITKHSLNSLQGDRDFTKLWETLATLKPNRDQKRTLQEVRANPLQPVERLQEKSEQLMGVLRNIRSSQGKLNEVNTLVEERRAAGVQLSEGILKRLLSFDRSMGSLVASIEAQREVMDAVASSLLEGKIDEALAIAQGFPQLSDRLHIQGEGLSLPAPQVTVVGGIAPHAKVIEIPSEQLQHGEVSSQGLHSRTINGVRLDGDLVALDRLSDGDLKKLCDKLLGMSARAMITNRSTHKAKYNLIGVSEDGKTVTVEVFETDNDGTHRAMHSLQCNS